MKGHIHAKSMAQYAEDAKTNEKPWELWESKLPTGDIYHQLGSNPTWFPETLYRRKRQREVTKQWEVKVRNKETYYIYTVPFDTYESAEDYCEEIYEKTPPYPLQVFQQPKLVTYEIEECHI